MKKTLKNNILNDSAIEDVYKDKVMDDKKDKLVNAFKNARTKINNGCYGHACEDILKECKKTNFVGNQAYIVRWCNNLIKDAKKIENAKKKYFK